MCDGVAGQYMYMYAYVCFVLMASLPGCVTGCALVVESFNCGHFNNGQYIYNVVQTSSQKDKV